MSKSLAIDTAAVWGANLTVPTDGDVFQEAVTDTYFDPIADRLGYLKTTVDAKAAAASPTFTGTANFANIDASGSVTAGSVAVDADVVMNGGYLSFSSGTSSGIKSRMTTHITSVTIAEVTDIVSVGSISGNIILTLPVGYNGQRVRVTRNRTADAFTVTVHNPSAATMGVISASNQGWIECAYYPASQWIVVGWGGTVTSISTTTA